MANAADEFGTLLCAKLWTHSIIEGIALKESQVVSTALAIFGSLSSFQ